MKRVLLSLAFCLFAFGSTAHAQRLGMAPVPVQEPAVRELMVEMQPSLDADGQNFRAIADTAGLIAENRAAPVCNYAAGERLMVDEAFNYQSSDVYQPFFGVTMSCNVSKQHHASCWANGVAGPAFIITVKAVRDAPLYGCGDMAPTW